MSVVASLKRPWRPIWAIHSLAVPSSPGAKAAAYAPVGVKIAIRLPERGDPAYAPIMDAFHRAMPRLICWISLPLLATPSLVGAQTAREAKPAIASPNSAQLNTGIIQLPLTPIVPASQRVCASKTPSGLGYTMLRAGSGARPAGDATALVSYVGYLATTGAVFDQNVQTPMPVGAVIPGFSEGLQLLSRTGIVRLCIPAAMAYGAQASETIPANSDLVFQVQLIDFKTAAEISEMRKAQAAQPRGQDEANPQH